MGSEKSFDSFLGIETIAETAFGDMDVCLPVNEEDNNYEVTYYNDLVTMFDEISMEPEDTLVDFGCGLGRVLFTVIPDITAGRLESRTMPGSMTDF